MGYHFTKRFLNLLQIHGFAPLGFSQKHDQSFDIAVKVFYEEDGWRCNFSFRAEVEQQKEICNTSGVEARRFEFVQRLSSALLGRNIYRSSSRPLLLQQQYGCLCAVQRIVDFLFYICFHLHSTSYVATVVT